MEKTTIILREDVKEAIEQEFGKRKISSVINELLFRELIAKQSGKMFGCLKGTKIKVKEVREHHDRF